MDEMKVAKHMHEINMYYGSPHCQDFPGQSSQHVPLEGLFSSPTV